MRRIIRYCLLFFFLLFAGSLTSNLQAQFYSVQTNTLKLATTTFNAEGSMLLSTHWTLNLGFSYNPWNFSDTRKIKHFLIEPGARYWFWQTYAGSFISMYAMGARYNVAWDGLLGGDYRYQGWGYGAGMTYGRSWLLSKRWNMDISCFNKIVSNLISNAFKYTPDKGIITIELKVENQSLIFCISNSGKGIAKENLSKIFDRYKILDSVEMNGKNSRTGLGLAICKSMITQLNGEISVNSVLYEMTTFTVTLPNLPITERETTQTTYETGLLHTATEEPIVLEKTAIEFDTGKRTVMVIDDDNSMLWFVSELFADKYNVCSFDNAKDALSSLEQKQPDLIISDVMMPGIDGLSFAQKIKQHKLWSHIPLILLSALHHEDDQVKGIESGAEAYVTKPFNVKYLEKIVYRLIKREADLKEYYSSIFSSFTMEHGNCIHKEDQEFLDKMLEIIEKNIANPDLQVELLSSEMGYSTRQFYRKLKPITEQSPADIIKEYRLTMAERLLIAKNLTIEEIMDQTGFNNRGTFYKLFSKRYGMPPRQYREQQKENVKKEKISGISDE